MPSFLLFSGILFWRRKKLCLCLPPCHQLLEIAYQYHWIIIWAKLVLIFWVFNEMFVLYGKTCVLINYFIGNFGQIFMLCYWLGFSRNIFGDSWISRVVCPSLDCVYYTSIFGVVYYIMVFPRVLDLLPPSVVYTLLPHIRQWVWVLSFSFCRQWGFPFANKFHPRRCSIIEWIDMFYLHPSLCFLLIGGFLCWFVQIVVPNTWEWTEGFLCFFFQNLTKPILTFVCCLFENIWQISDCF